MKRTKRMITQILDTTADTTVDVWTAGNDDDDDDNTDVLYSV